VKKLIVFVLLVTAGVMFFVGCDVGLRAEEYLRIHIRANSNSFEDQNVKYKVKEVVVNYLTPYILECENYDDVVAMINSKEKDLEILVDGVLKDNGFNYVSDVELNEEFFPTRTYESLTLVSDFYDAVIIKLGEAVGDNWWCVVYPPLCFKDTKNVVYKSKILEIINQFI